MKITPTNICRLMSERISGNFRKSQNKKPTIVKDRIGFKLNLGILQFEWSREWSSLSGKNTTFSGDAGSKPALHSFYPHLSFSFLFCFTYIFLSLSQSIRDRLALLFV